MRRYRLFLTALAGLALMCSCGKQYDPDPVFISGDTVCLKVDGSTIHTYQSGSWQAAYRSGANQYRIFSDDNKDYYKVVCSQKPESEGQEITATVTWGTRSSASVQRKEGVKFNVQRIDPGTGTIWLWSRKGNMGVTVIQTE